LLEEFDIYKTQSETGK